MDELDNRERLDWFKLEKYTGDFKEWILNLFRKVHARIGHVEEDLAKLKRKLASNYIILNQSDSEKIKYTLFETVSGKDHGSITIDPATGGFIPTWTDDIDENIDENNVNNE